jgi:hypothetical protein
MAPRRWLGLGLLVAWTASLALPVFTTCSAGYDHVGGWFLLLVGWFGILVWMPAWLANVAIVGIGAALYFHRRPPIWLGVLTAVVAATAWRWEAWADDTGERPICHYHAGYWLWLGAAALALLATIVVRFEAGSAARAPD